MRRMLALVALCLALCVPCLSAEPIVEPQDETLVKIDTSVLSKFLDRSVLRVDDAVSKTDVRIEHKGFGLEFRGELDMNDERNLEGEFADIDLQFDYTWKLLDKKLDLQVGAVYYAYPNTDMESTEELFVKASYELPMGFKPYVGTWLDVDENDGLYTEVGVNHVFDLTDKLKVAKLDSVKVLSHINMAYGSENHNEYYFGEDNGGFQMVKLGTGVEVGFLKNWTITPSVEYYNMLDEDLTHAVDNADDDAADGWILGLSLGCKF